MISIAIHGGAGTIDKNLMTAELESSYHQGLKEALQAGYELLEKGASSLDAVEAAVMQLENNPLFNAGRGSVFTHTGTHEMDAAVMEGAALRAGAVAGIRGVVNPVQLARLVMEKSDHVLLCGTGAEEFAKLQNVAFAGEEYFYVQHRYDQWQQALQEDRVVLDHSDKKFGTVGAVAIDQQGNLAAATSTGGMTNKKFGRIGDSPIIGSGTYANNDTCAISCTGHGELFLRSVVAYDVSALMEYKNLSLQQACYEVVQVKLVKIEGEGGLIAVDKNGNIHFEFNSTGMYRGYRTSAEKESYTAIYR